MNNKFNMRLFNNKSFNITVFTVCITVLLQFIFIRFTSYQIDKETYGNFVLLQTLIAGLSTVLLQIPSQSFDRFFNTTNNKLIFINEFRTLLILINILSVFFIIIYSFFYERFSFEIYVIVLIVFFILNNFSFNQKIFLFSLERKKYFYIKISESIAKFLFPIIFYMYFKNLESLLIGLLTGYLLSFLLISKMLKEYPFKIQINMMNYKKYFNFAYPIFFVSIFTWGISFSDRYFIDYFLTTSDVGIYSLLAIVAGIGQIIGQIYFMYVEPIILKEYEINRKNSFNQLSKYIKILSLVFLLLSLIAYIIPKEIYTLLLERDVVYNNYYFNTMMILLLSIFLLILQSAFHLYFKLLKKLYLLATIYFVGFIVNIILNFYIKEYGIMMAAISTLLAYLIILILEYILIKQELKKIHKRIGNN